jgi:TonB family protein
MKIFQLFRNWCIPAGAKAPGIRMDIFSVRLKLCPDTKLRPGYGYSHSVFATILFLFLAAQTAVSQTTLPADVYTSREFLNQCIQDKVYLFLSSKTAESLLIQRVNPQMHHRDMEAVVTGTVVIAFEITREGTVRHAMVISGPKMLQPPVLEAFRQWRYKPYLLNGKPTIVATSASIPITLNNWGVTVRNTPSK